MCCFLDVWRKMVQAWEITPNWETVWSFQRHKGPSSPLCVMRPSEVASKCLLDLEGGGWAVWLESWILVLLLPLTSCVTLGKGPFASLTSVVCVFSGLAGATSRPFHMYYFLFFFNWRKVALQCCVDFCCTTTQISHNFVYICPHPPETPSPPPSHPSWSSQSTRLVSLCYIAISH